MINFVSDESKFSFIIVFFSQNNQFFLFLYCLEIFVNIIKLASAKQVR